MTPDTAWMAGAACARRPDLPWTTDTADVSAWDAATMRTLCQHCPVLFDCLDAVDYLGVTGGWWAGRDRDPYAVDLPPAPAWAVEWVPVRTRRRGVIATQSKLVLDGLGAA